MQENCNNKRLDISDCRCGNGSSIIKIQISAAHEEKIEKKDLCLI